MELSLRRRGVPGRLRLPILGEEFASFHPSTTIMMVAWRMMLSPSLSHGSKRTVGVDG